MNSKVYISKCDDYSAENINKALDALLEGLGGLDWVKPGMKIGIKLNLCVASAPEKAATTHPALAVALAGKLQEKGAGVILGDSPGGPFVPALINKLYDMTGLRKYINAGNFKEGTVVLNDNFEDTEVEYPRAVSVKHFRYTDWLKECDEIINFCKLKSHGLTGITAAVKNLYGVIPGTVKSEYHFLHTDPLDFANMLVDLNEYVKPRFVFVDAVDIMEGNGPTKGTPRHMGLVLAGENPYTLDRVGARLLGVSEEEIPYLIAAKQRNLLSDEPGDNEIGVAGEECAADGLIKEYCLTDFVRSGATSCWFANSPDDKGFRKFVKKALYVIMRSKPKTGAGCTGCGHCASMCPAGAIKIKNGKAVIDRRKCVRCFC